MKYVDPDGLRPKSKVAALMAKYVYKDDNHQITALFSMKEQASGICQT